MALETVNICDSCNKRLDEGDEIYCQVCVEELRTEIEELKEDVRILEDKLSTLSNA